jgi:hypothetical protein
VQAGEEADGLGPETPEVGEPYTGEVTTTTMMTSGLDDCYLYDRGGSVDHDDDTLAVLKADSMDTKDDIHRKMTIVIPWPTIAYQQIPSRADDVISLPGMKWCQCRGWS